MKRAVSILLFVLILTTFFGCNSNRTKDLPIFATVKITAQNEQIILNETVKVPLGSSAADAVGVACRSKKIAYQDKNGLYDDFNAISSTKEEGWLFYFNGELAEQGLKQTNLAEDAENIIEMRYENFSEVYSK